MKKCPICRRRFRAKRDWQIYDKAECRREAWSRRERDRIRQELMREIGA